MPEVKQVLRLLFLALALCSALSAKAADSLTLRATATTTQPLTFRPLDTVEGVAREVATASGLIVFRDTIGQQKVLIAENTANAVDAPQLATFDLVIDGKTYSVADMGRMRKIYFAEGDFTFRDVPMIAPNTVTWGPEWNQLTPFKLAPLVPDTSSGARSTGGAPRYGVRLAFGRIKPVSSLVELGRGVGYMPVTLRDPVTFKLVRDLKVRVGYNPQNVKGLDPAQLGMKWDWAHGWSGREAREATKGTALARFYRDCVEALGVSAVMFSVPGDATQAEVREQGRRLRGMADWLEIEDDPFVRACMTKSFDYYEAHAADAIDIYQGIIREKPEHNLEIKHWQFAQLAYGVSLAEQRLGRESKWLKAYLDFHCKTKYSPYVLEVCDSTGRRLSIPEIVAHEEMQIAAAAKDPNPDNRDLEKGWMGEQGFTDWLCYQKRLPQRRAVDDPKYLAAFNQPNNAGFYFPAARPPLYDAQIGALWMSFKTQQEARDWVTAEMQRRVGAWANGIFSEAVRIEERK